MISDKLQNQFNKIASILNEIGERVEGNLVCDVSSDNIIINQNFEKIENIRYLAKNRTKICEVGVNAGHSLLIMLEVNPTAHYQLFDLGYHQYTRPCLEYIQTQYPNTLIDIVYGDSKKTIRTHIIENKKEMASYDFIHIDGGHGDLELSSDFYLCSVLNKMEGILIMDDYNYPNIKDFIDTRVKSGIIKRYENLNLKATNKQFIYTY